MEFQIEPVHLKVLMGSDQLFELMGEIDSNNPEVLEIHSGRDEALRFISKGISGKMEVCGIIDCNILGCEMISITKHLQRFMYFIRLSSRRTQIWWITSNPTVLRLVTPNIDSQSSSTLSKPCRLVKKWLLR
jgi:hypothetical protein